GDRRRRGHRPRVEVPRGDPGRGRVPRGRVRDDRRAAPCASEWGAREGETRVRSARVTRGRADRAIEAAVAARVREGPSGVVAILDAARKAAPEIHGREGAIHAILHRLARRRTIAPVGHGADGGVLWAAGEGPPEGTALLATLGALFLVKAFVAEPRNVPSHSMEPTLRPGDRVIVWKVGGQREPKRWDVVVFRRPSDDMVLVKRAVGLGGETIQI